MYTFSAGQAVAILNGASQPGMPANINTNWAGVRTDSTLNTAAPIWYNLSLGEHFVFATISKEKVIDIH